MRTLDHFNLRSLRTGRWVGDASTATQTFWVYDQSAAKVLPATAALQMADQMTRVGNHVTMVRIES